MSPKPDVSAERKNQIVESAISVFARRGLKDATMDDIVAESGLSKGALYWYFKSKDEIIGSIVDYFFNLELADIRALPQAPGSARERLQQFTKLTIAELRRMKPVIPIVYEFYSLAFRHKRVQKVLRRYMNAYLDILTPLIEQGIEQGEFRKVNARQVSISLGAVIEGTALLWAFDQKAFPLEAQLDAGMQTVLAGIEMPTESSR
ncbi:MAG: TetR/AcrR family transcriptional regulator [Rudaea sp.]